MRTHHFFVFVFLLLSFFFFTRYLKAAAHLMLTRVDTTMSGGSPINPIHVHGMATAGGPPVTLTPLASPMQRDAVKRCEIMGSGDGMIMYVCDES